MHILLIPGWQETTSDWEPTAAKLQQLGYPTTIVEYYTPKNTDIDDQVEIAQQYINRKTLVVGYSVGGRIAVQLLHQKMHHVAGGLLLSTPSLKHAGWFGRMVKIVTFVFAPIRLLTPGFIKKYLYAGWKKLLHRDETKRQYARMIDSEQETLLPLITVPVKLVWGAADRLVSPKIGQAMAAMIPNADYIEVTKLGAAIHQENPALMAEIIAGFADDLS